MSCGRLPIACISGAAEIRQTLLQNGWHYQLADLGTPLTRLVRRKLLRRTQVTDGGKKIWKYSNY